MHFERQIVNQHMCSLQLCLSQHLCTLPRRALQQRPLAPQRSQACFFFSLTRALKLVAACSAAAPTCSSTPHVAGAL